jgi:Mrp family chromosome partitioning ATPase
MMLKLSQQSQLIPLYQCIEAMVEKPRGKLIVLLSGLPGEGASTIAAGLGDLCGGVLGRSVLVMEARFDRRSQAIQQQAEPEAFHRQEIHAIGTKPTRDALHSDIAQFREGYDYVLLVTPPLSVDPMGLEWAQHADGVVLVIEAERTQWKTSRRMCDEIIGTGGNLLGVVLNKRRHHLPNWLARWF